LRELILLGRCKSICKTAKGEEVLEAEILLESKPLENIGLEEVGIATDKDKFW
jgi:dihydrolipoamide dehydrogenase